MKANKTEEHDEGPVKLTGKVVQKKFAQGSKSEHDAFYLVTKEGEYRLRRVGGNPFSDPELKKLLGKNVTASGTLNDSFFLAKSIIKDKK